MVAVVTGSGLGVKNGSGFVLGSRGVLGDSSVGRFGENVTVNAATGNVFINRTDEVLLGVGPDSAISSVYNSLGAFTDDNGDNWRLNAQRRVVLASGSINGAGSTVMMTDWDGSETSFAWDVARNAYLSKQGAGAFDTITHASGIWTWTDGNDRVTDRFESTKGGRVATRRDIDGNQLSYTYDDATNGQLVRVTTTNGEYTDLSWNGNKLIQLTTRASGGSLLVARARYTYDAQNRLSTVKTDLTPGDGSDSDNNVNTITYIYEGNSTRISTISETGANNYVNFTYDGSGRVLTIIESQDASVYRETTFSYVSSGSAGGTTTVTDANGKVSVLTYDADRNLTSVSYPPAMAGAVVQVVNYLYDADGNVISATDAAGKLTSYSYDDNGNLTQSINPAGEITKYEYDSTNHLKKKIVIPVLTPKTPLPINGVDLNYYIGIYGDLGNLGDLIDAEWHYGAQGWTERRKPNAVFDTNFYLNTYPDIAAAGMNPLQHYLEYGWWEGRLPAAGVSTAEFIARYVNQTTRYAYDAEGHLRFAISPEGRVTEYRYDTPGQQISKIDYTKNYFLTGELASTADLIETTMMNWVSMLGSAPAVQRIDTTYDFRGNVASTTEYADLYENRIRYSQFEQGTAGWMLGYDASGIAVNDPVSGLHLGKNYLKEHFNATAAGQVLSLATGASQWWPVTAGERLSVQAGVAGEGPVGTLALAVHFLDASGNYVSGATIASLNGGAAYDSKLGGFVTVPTGATKARFELYMTTAAAGTGAFVLTEPTVSQATTDEAVVTPFVAGPTSNDLAGNEAKSASFTRTSYTYDQFGLLLAKSKTGLTGSEVYTYDGMGRLISATDLVGAVTTTVFNDAARSTVTTLSNGATKTSIFTAQGELWSMTDAASGISSQATNYRYDKLGRLRSTILTTGAYDFIFYDDAGQKTGYVDYNGTLTEYRYDAAGRVVATIQWENRLTAAQTTSLLAGPGSVNATLTVASIRPVAWDQYDHWTWTIYDNADRVAQTITTIDGARQNPYGSVTSYDYDGAGRLIKTTVSANKLSQAVVTSLKAQSPGARNLWKNGAFDSGTQPWNQWGPAGITFLSPQTVTTNAEGALAITSTFQSSTADNRAVLYSDNWEDVSLLQGERFAASASVSASGAISRIELHVEFFDANWQGLDDRIIATLHNPTATPVTLSGFSAGAPAGAKYMRLSIYGMNSAVNTTASISVAKPMVSQAPTALNLWRNTSFENGTDMWNRWDGDPGISHQGPMTIVTDASGNKAISATFKATQSNSNGMLWSDSWRFDNLLTGQRFAISENISFSGAVSRVDVYAEFYNAAGQYLSSTALGSVTSSFGTISTIIPGMPANGKWMRLIHFAIPSALNATGTFSISAPMVSYAHETQTSVPVFSANYSKAPAFSTVPAASAKDQVSRNFYSGDGLLIATLGGDGALKRLTYDKAGRLIKTVAFASLVPQHLRASANLGALLNSIPRLASDRTERLIYNGEGQVRYRLDGTLRPTEYIYNAAGDLIRTIDYGASIAPTSSYSQGYVRGEIGRLNLVSNGATRISRSIYDGAGRRTFDIDALGRVTGYVYNNMGQLVRTWAYTATYAGTGDPTVTAMWLWSDTNFSDSNDRRTRSIYDGFGRLAYAVDAGGYVTETQYDSLNRVTKTIRYPNSYPVGDGATAASMAAQIGALPATAITRTYAYDPGGNVVDEWLGQGADLGIRTHYDYNASDKYWQKIEAYGTADAATTVYVYDSNSRLVALNQNAGTTGQEYVVGYSYDGIGNLTTLWDPKDAGTGNGTPTTYDYDASGQLLSKDVNLAGDHIWTYYQYNAFGEVVAETDARGNTTTFSYDILGNLLTKTVPLEGSATAITTYQYDVFGNVVKVIDPRGYVSCSYYDKLGRLTLATDQEGYATETGYTAMGEVAWVKRYAVKAGDIGLPGDIPVGNPNVRPTLHLDDKDATTSFTYDKLSRVTRSTDALNFYEDYTYDAFGNRLTVRNKLGAITTYSYDKRGLLLEEILPGTAYRSSGTQPVIVNRFEYDLRGNRIRTIEAYGLAEQRTTSYAYDKRDRLISKTGDVQLVHYHNGSSTWSTPVETYQYDLRGNLLLVTDAAGGKTFSYYDLNNRKIAEVNAVGTLSAWTYDPNGNVTSAKVYGDALNVNSLPTGTPAPTPINGGNCRETTFQYDKANRQTASQVWNLRIGYWTGSAYVATTSSPAVQNTYDANGNITSQRNGAGSLTYYYYDKLGRKIAQIDTQNYLTTYELDANGNVVTEIRHANAYTGTPPLDGTFAGPPPSVTADATNDRKTTFTYDRNGQRLTEARWNVSYAIVNGNSVQTATANMQVGYTYTALGQVFAKVETTGDTTYYYYDNMGRLTQENRPTFLDVNNSTLSPQINYYYDGLNNLVRTREGNGSNFASEDHIYSAVFYAGNGRLYQDTDANSNGQGNYYDEMGRLTFRTYAHRFSDDSYRWEAESTRYDLAGRVIEKTTYWNNGSAWVQQGDITKIVYNAYGEVASQGINNSYPIQMSYDSAGRVWKSTAQDGTVQLFMYNGNGNLTLTIASNGAALPSGYSWSTITLEQAISLLTNNGANTIGTIDVAGMVVTAMSYSARGELVYVREMRRQFHDAAGNAVTQDIERLKAYNAFGEVSGERDGRGNWTYYLYNTMGRLTQKQNPDVSWTAENGAQTTSRPTEYYYYDGSGRLIGMRDANGGLITRTLLAGTGYGGGEALITQEFRPDGGVLDHRYDVFGDKRVTINEIGAREDYSYDKMHRVTRVDHAQRADGTKLTDYYAYDILGQRIKQWNNLLGTGYVAKTDYDVQGRVTKQVELSGDTTSYEYTWNNSIVANGSGVVAGGWEKKTTNSANKISYENTDYFGRVVWRQDFGGHSYAYNFDLVGRLIQQSNSEGNVVTYSYYNTGLMATMLSNVGAGYGSNVTSNYQYDADGNRTYESYSATVKKEIGRAVIQVITENVTHQQARVTWDAMNRMVSYTDTAASTSSPVTVNWQYDANGNIRRMTATYRLLNEQGAYVITGSSTQDYWYRYDNMNRMVITKGSMSGGVISKGNDGFEITYDAAGNRKTVKKQTAYSKTFAVFNGSQYVGQEMPYYGDRLEIYSYTNDGYLETVKIGDADLYWDGYSQGSGTVIQPTTESSGIRVRYVRDLMGRVSRYYEYNIAGYDGTHEDTNTVFRKNSYYQSGNQTRIDYETQSSKVGTDAIESTTYFYYNANLVTDPDGKTRWEGVEGTGTYMGGVVTRTRTTSTKNNVFQPNSYNTNSFRWWDGAIQVRINYDNDQTHNKSVFNYDSAGRLQSIKITDGRSRDVIFVTDSQGQVLQRDEDDDYGSGDPRDLRYYFGGKQIGLISNNGTSNVDYTASINAHATQSGTGPFRNGANGHSSYADFDQSYDAINGNYEASSGQYMVQAGDTLEGIAQKLWGDGSYWYLIAQANGLSGSNSLSAGQSLILPNKVHNSRNNASTFRVYDPNEAIGDTSPTAVKPKGKDCGVFGQILMMAIAIAVSVLTYGALTSASTGILGSIAAGAASGAAGSIASQGFGVATGIQDKFSWKGVALGALAGAVGGGFQGWGNVADKAIATAGSGGVSTLTRIGSFLGRGGFTSGAVRGVLSSGISQGIGVATKLQDGFSWSGVAAAGLAGGVMGALGGDKGLFGLKVSQNGIGSQIVRGMAGNIAGATARSLIDGTDFGDNIIAGLPDVIGGVISNTIGNIVADQVAGNGRPRVGGSTTGAGDGTSAQPAPGAGGSGSDDAQFGDIVVTAQLRDAVYRPSDYGSLFQLAHYRPNPRVRMGGNGGPPLNDPLVITQVFPGLQNAPGGAIIGLIDNIFDLTGPANALTTDLAKGFSSRLIDQIQEIDPSYRYDTLEPGGFPSTRQGQMNMINNLRLDRAEAFYRIGEMQPLQVETLRYMQGRVDAAYARGLQELQAGRLDIRLSSQEALGNYVDRAVRDDMRIFYNQLGISTARGEAVQVNRWARNTSEGSYTIPDNRVGNVAFDVSLTRKTISTPQVRGFFGSDFRPSTVIIVRPSQLGAQSTYAITHPR